MQFRKLRKVFSLRLFFIGGLFLLLQGNTQTHAVYQDFVDQLKIMNITIENVIKQESISRYELTRLLNAVKCIDCINEESRMQKDYNDIFWNTFSKLPGKDFDDIPYLDGKYNNNNYYYCVAYVGDHDYMRGYPSEVSPVCAGQFCGTRNVTKAEFLQVIINLIAQYIYPNYSVNWNDVQSWMFGLKTNSDANNYLNDNDRSLIVQQAITCKEESCKLTNVADFKTYLKYCMYNINTCGMQEFGFIKQAYWPVAELNILYQQEIIDYEEAQQDDIHDAIAGDKVIDILSKVHEIIGCQFNNDYDCDGGYNSNDNCPNDYNPTQTDTDGDGIGDVCDGDIDGDGVANPIGIVDDSGNINIGVADPNMDNCLLVQNPDQVITEKRFIGDACSDLLNKVALYINIDQINGSVPLTTTFSAVTKGSVENISWNFGDYSYSNKRKVEHTYYEPGTYTITAHAQGPNNEAIATATVIVGENLMDHQGIMIRTNKLKTSAGGDIQFSVLSIGNIDSVERDFGDGTIVNKNSKSSFSKVFTHAGSYTVTAKAWKNNEIIGVSMLHISIGTHQKGTQLYTERLTPQINQEVKFSTHIEGFRKSDISFITRDFGDEQKEKTIKGNISHTYTYPGTKVVKQVIKLKDASQFTNLLTLYVNDTNTLKSYGIFLKPSKLRARKGELISFDLVPKGDTIRDALILTFQHTPGALQRIFSPTIHEFKSDSSQYFQQGIFYPKGSLTLNQCQIAESKSTIIVHGMDICLEALLQGTLDQFKCDMDADGIPDICDNDIDGDGILNLLGIITHENEDCSIGPDNTNTDNTDSDDMNVNLLTLEEHLNGSCRLDNCAFTINKNQFDLNQDGIGDVCEENTADILQQNNKLFRDPIKKERTNQDSSIKDTDNDGIPDRFDACVYLAENYNGIEDLDGCPEIGIEENCRIGPGDGDGDGNGDCTAIICSGPCNQCPCQYTDFLSDLIVGDIVKANLFDWDKIWLYSQSDTKPIPVFLGN